MALSFFISLFLAILFGNPIISALKQINAKQFIREDGPAHHLTLKSQTPTMGGFIFLIPILLMGFSYIFLFNEYHNKDFVVVLVVTLVLALLGFTDDVLKVFKKHNKGISGWLKLFIQFCVSVALFFIYKEGSSIFYLLWIFFIIAGSSNSYNLTDGLDGLLGSVSVVSFFGFAILFYLLGRFDLFIFSLIVMGALIGFLYFNWHPAKVFMGDTGSLALGGVVGTLAIISKIELILIFFALVPILEAISVILQVLFFKITKKITGEGERLFKMAPLHHHFELLGWKELSIVKRFTIVQVLSVLIGIFVLNYFI